MPTYTFTSPRTGSTYNVDFANDPNEADLEEARADLDMREQTLGQNVFQASTGEIGRSALSVPKGVIGGAGAVASMVPGMEDNFLQRGAESFEEGYSDLIPVDPALKDSPIVKASGAVGQGLGMLGLTYFTGGLGATPAVARGVGLGAAGMMGAEQGAKTAEQYGVTNPWERAALISGGAVTEAGTEMLGGLGSKDFTSALLGRLKSATRPGTAFTRAAKTIGSEAIEEPIAGQLQDFLTTGIVDEDPNRPGFALNGAALPPDTLSMQNLYNRLEEGALGAIGGTVFAGAEYLGSRTQTDEALALRMQAQNVINDLRSKQTLTPEEQDQLARMEAEDQNVGAWLERQGMDKVRPALDAMMDNPELSDSERSEAISYAALIDNLSAVENAPEATAEEIQGAREAVSNHPLNRRENKWNRVNQQESLNATYAEKVKRLKEDLAATKKPTLEQAAVQEAQQEAIVAGAPETAAALAQLTEEEPSIPVSPEAAAVAPQTAAVLQQIVSEPQTIERPAEDALEIQSSSSVGPLPSGDQSLGRQEGGQGVGLLDQGQETPTEGLQEEVNVQPLPQTPVPQQPAQPALEAVQETVQPAPAGPATAGSTGAPSGMASTGTPAASPKPQLRRPRVQLGIAVSPREIQRAVRKFSRIGPMRIASAQELAQDPTLRSLFSSEEAWQDFVENQLPYAEGLSNDGTGSAVIIPENLAIYNTDQERAQRNGTTAGEEAMIRVMLHENWHGIERWLEHSGDPAADTLKERYYGILNEIPEQELDDLAKRRYHHLSNWRDDGLSKRILQSEVLAERREMAELTGEPDSLIEKFFAWLRDVLKTVTGTNQEPTPDELQELFNAWYRAQKSTQTRAGPVQESLTEIPPRPQVPVSYQDRGTGNTLDEILDSMWRPFYSAWESRQVEAGKPLDQKQLAKDWQKHISDPDFLFDKDLDLRIEKKNAGRNWVDIEYAPRELTAPETGPKQTKRKATKTPTPEDIRDRYPQFSLPERPVTPEMDRAYMEAVERGDMETAQRMVDEAAKKSESYIPKVVGLDVRGKYVEVLKNASIRERKPLISDGMVGFILSPASGNIFFFNRMRALHAEVLERLKLPRDRMITGLLYRDGAMITDATGGPYSGNPKTVQVINQRLKVKPENQYFYDEDIEGHWGKREEVPTPSDPVTRDDQGNVIPLSQRFNPKTTDIRFSLPELTPEQQQARLAEITDQLSYTPSTEHQEGQSPAQATKDQRQYKDGTPVEMYRTGVSGVELDELSKEALGIAISNSPDGPSETFGADLMKYMRGEIPTLYGMPDNAFLKTAIAINLEHDPLQRNRLGIDGGDLRKIIQQNLSLAGRTLRSAAHGRLYQALKEMAEKGDKLVDDNAESSIGIKDFKSLADGVNNEVVQATLPLADEVVIEDIVSTLADSAQFQADTADFSAAIESLPPKERKTVRDLLNELEELDELLRMEAEMSAGQVGPAASRAEVRAQKMTLAEVQAKIAQKRQNITRLVEEIEKAKVQGDPVEAAKKVVKRVRKSKEAPPAENDRLRQWAAGKLEVEGLGKPAKTIQKYIQAGGLNTNSLTTVLTTAFPEANPVFVVGLVNRMADLIDGRATKDGILDDIKKGGGKPDPKLVEKMVRIAEQARKGREKAIQSMEKKLDKVKNPTPQKLKQRSKFVNLLQEGMNSGILDSDVVRAAFAQAYDLHGMTPERLKEMADLMNEIDSLPDGTVKETFHLRWMQILNDIAPASSISGMAFSAYMGYVLQGVGTMIAQTSNLANFLTPLAFAHSFGQIYATTQGTPLKKLFTALSLRRNWNVALSGMKSARENLALIQAGVSGIKSSTGQGIGVTPIELTQTPYETSLAWTSWGQISEFRLKPNKLMEQMGVMKLFRVTRLPAWVASRSFQVIRGAEGWSGGVERDQAFRRIAITELQTQGKSYDEAYRMVEDALNDKTNAQMWEEAYKEADRRIAEGTVNKAARKPYATELVQDMLDKKWDLILANRHRQQSAVANFKTDPITPMGAGAYHLVSMALKHQHWGPIPNPLRFGFLFPRFFINSMEQAYMYSPAGLLGATGIRTNLTDSEMKERQQRIVQIYGSLENYKSQRIGKGMTGTALLTGIGAMMTAAMQMWDPDDDEPPMFWMTGDVIGRYDRRGILSETGWWAPNTMYIMGMKFNYVNASPQFGMILNAAGNIGDRFMFPELLGTKYNARTKEYEESFAEQWIRPVGESIAAPMSRSTYRTFYDALDNAMGGDFKKLTRLATQPLSGTATALTMGVIPSLKTFEKLEKSNIQPRSPQDISQTLQAGVPFANSLGLDVGKPLYSPFGEELTPYNFFTFLSNSQEATEDSKKAAKILLDLGVSKQPPKLEYLGDGVVEVAHEGKYYLLPPEQRNRIIMQMGQDLAKSIIREKAKLQKLEKEKGRDAVSDRVGTLASEARKRALARFKPEK